MHIEVKLVDYKNEQQGKDLVMLLNAYAQDPMGGGSPLKQASRDQLVEKLAQLPYAFSLLAYADGEPVGLVNCFEAFSTFACQPLINIHDVAVLKSHRGQGVSKRLLEQVEVIAKERGCCKLTLEVLSNNDRAKFVYEKFGFSDYALEPAAGTALFWQKKLS
ncbi:MAG: GNAT family N-acetyltransferase [Pseudomonadales bacterium]|nr:GNAT family N-acetyltransferase [Pseudomonadales bacterium]